jgi:hypothetical protein
MATSQSLESNQSGKASSKHQSPAEAHVDTTHVDVNDDEQSEAQLKLNEHEL